MDEFGNVLFAYLVPDGRAISVALQGTGQGIFTQVVGSSTSTSTPESTPDNSERCVSTPHPIVG